MDLAWGDPNLNKFVTNVGLITSNGKYGHNIMACEWTHMISYAPALIALAIRDHKATFQNIQETKEFGVNLTAVDQNVVSSVAGKSTGKEINKIAVLKELGVNFYDAERIDVLMVEGASMNAECKLVETIDIGDHPLIIGEILHIKHTDKDPLIYHQTKYWKVGERVEKPGQETMDRIKELKDKHIKKT